MEFISRYWTSTRAHLAALNASQRVAIGLCAVLVMIGVAWLVQWSGQPQRVPLLSQSLSADEQTNIVTQLRAMGAEFDTQGGAIRVAEEDRPRLLARLQQTRALPANTSISFAKLMDENNPFLARDDAQWRKERALEGELSSVLSHFDGLEDAKVFIQIPQRRRIGADSARASASVWVRSRPGATLDKAIVMSIADFISGAVEGLTADAVKIVDAATGRSFRIPGKEDSLPFDVLDLRRQREEHYAKKIADHLSYIAGVLVGVHADLNLERRQTVDKRRSGKPVIMEEESTSSTSNRASGAAGPGTKANVGRAITAGAAGDSTNKEESKTSYAGLSDERIENTEIIPGDIRRLTASINVPRSYFAGIYKQLNPQAPEAKDADLDPIMAREMSKIRGQIKPLVAAADETQVEVNWFYDSVVAAGPGAGAGIGGAGAGGGSARAGAGEGLMPMLREFGPQVGLGLLALASLAMVLRLARRATAAIERATVPAKKAEASASAAVEEERVGALKMETGPVGEAVMSEAVLEGREVDADEIRIRHIIGQIGQMVKEDTGTAAALVEHWVAEKG